MGYNEIQFQYVITQVFQTLYVLTLAEAYLLRLSVRVHPTFGPNPSLLNLIVKKFVKIY